MRKLLVAILLGSLFSACSTGGGDKGIRLDLSKKKKIINYSEIVDSIKTIPLETTKEYLVGAVDQIQMDDSLIFILDARQRTIFIFNESGKYVTKIAHEGKGEGEYVAISSFCLDITKKLLCLQDGAQRKIVRYSYRGNYVSTLKYEADRIVREMGILPNRNLIFITPGYEINYTDAIWEVDSLGNRLKSLVKSNPNHQFMFIPRPYHSNLDGVIRFYDGYTNDLFSIVNDEVRLESHFDLVQRIPEKYLKNRDGYKHSGTGNYYMNNHMAENQTFFYLRFKSNNKGEVNVFFNKKTKRLWVADQVVDDINRGPSPTGIYTWSKDALLAVVWPEDGKLNPELQLLYMKS